MSENKDGEGAGGWRRVKVRKSCLGEQECV